MIMAVVAIGLTALASPVTELPIKDINGKKYYYYKVVKKETLYSLSRKLGLSQEQIIFYNPTVYDGLKANDILYFPAEDFTDGVPTPSTQPSDNADSGSDSGNVTAKTDINSQSSTQTVTHDVVKGETIYGISHRYGITTEQLMDANPAIRSGLKAGMSLIIPSPDDAPETNHEIVRNVESQIHAQRKRDASSIDIAVLLSFDLDAPKKDRDAQYSLEFYKGFLLAVDTLRELDRPIHITTYDVGSSDSTLKSILDRAEMKHMQVIIPPVDIKGGLEMVGEYGRANDVMVFNIFNVRDKSYLTNPAMMQATVPQEVMYAKAVEGFMGKYKTTHPCFSSKKDRATATSS